VGQAFDRVWKKILFAEKIAEFDGGIRAVSGPTATAMIFATYPEKHVGLLGSIIDQVRSLIVLFLDIKFKA
jgi:hypothetical protein